MESRRWIIMRISRRTVAAAAAVLTGLASLGTAGAAFASPSTRRANGGEDVGHGRVGNGEDHDLAGDRLAAVGVADQLGGVAALVTTPAMAWPMLPVPMIVTCVMEMLPSGEVSCCYN